VTSSAVTAPPDCSTAVVNWLTAGPPAGTSSRTVIEYETEGRAVTLPIFSRQYWLSAADAAGVDYRRFRIAGGGAAAVATVACH
jgi:hypothetical protein